MLRLQRKTITVYDCEPGPDGSYLPVRRREVPVLEALTDEEDVIRDLRRIASLKNPAANVTILGRRVG